MFIAVFTLVLFAILHFGLSLPLVGALFIPQVGFLVLGLVMLCREPSLKLVGAAILMSGALVALVVALSPVGAVEPSRRLLSGVQLVYSLGVAAAIAGSRPFSREEARQAANWLSGYSLLVIVIGVLELFTPVKSYSDAFRELAFSGMSYAADARDYGIAGFIRPKAFASEPSHAAWSIAMMLVSSIAFRPTRAQMGFVLAVLFAGTLVFMSPNLPITGVFVSLMAGVMFWDRTRMAEIWTGIGLIAIGGAALGTILVVTLVSGRVDAYLGLEQSLFVRVVQPVQLTAIALNYNWLVGIGFGGLETIWTQISQIEGGAGAANLNRTPAMAIMTIPLYSGVLGILCFSSLIFWLFRRLPGKGGVLVIGVLIFTLLQKQSFVITTAWIVAAIWMLQARIGELYARSPAAAFRAEQRHSGRQSSG